MPGPDSKAQLIPDVRRFVTLLLSAGKKVKSYSKFSMAYDSACSRSLLETPGRPGLFGRRWLWCRVRHLRSAAQLQPTFKYEVTTTLTRGEQPCRALLYVSREVNLDHAIYLIR